MATAGRTGRLIIVSGPSGAGKSTLLERLLVDCPLPLVMSVSATTRPPRQGEIPGRHYHFLTPQAFEEMRRGGEFLECFEVHGRGTWYGTPRSEVTSGLAAGKWVVLEIDVQGARAVVEQFPEAVTIFVHPGSPAELERRLRGRGTESEAEIQRRLVSAQAEWAAQDFYHYHVVNDDLSRAERELCDLLIQLGEPGP